MILIHNFISQKPTKRGDFPQEDTKRPNVTLHGEDAVLD